MLSRPRLSLLSHYLSIAPNAPSKEDDKHPEPCRSLMLCNRILSCGVSCLIDFVLSLSANSSRTIHQKTSRSAMTATVQEPDHKLRPQGRAVVTSFHRRLSTGWHRVSALVDDCTSRGRVGLGSASCGELVVDAALAGRGHLERCKACLWQPLSGPDALEDPVTKTRKMS